MPAWRHWYHAITSTYGSWLPGDPRGFRTRKHREHVQGDYKSPPPPGRFETRHADAHRKLKRPAVVLNALQRRIVLEEFRETLVAHDVRVIAIAVAATHLHVLAQLPARPSKPTFIERGLRRTSAIDDPVRHLMGIAKQWSAKRLVREGHVASGPVWGKRGKIVPIRDRRHQINVCNYVVQHAEEGAEVWTFREAQ
ncbi:MAG: hypothetical protein KJZ69_09970 [Phycisphaerales bacterium]|nr:hypothetical protein [Phycisphaerales bacterium]